MLNLNKSHDFVFPIFYTDLALSLIRSRQGNIEQFFEKMHMNPEDLNDPNQNLTFSQFKETIQICLDSLIPGEPPFLQLLRHLPTTAHGMVGLTSMTAATLSDALDVGIEFFPLLLPTFELRRENIDDQSHVVIKCLHQFGSPIDELLVELVIASFARMIDFATSAQVKSDQHIQKSMEVQFVHTRTEYLDAYYHFFGKPVQFGSVVNRFAISRSVLSLPLLTYNRMTHEALLATLNRQLKNLPQSRPLTLRVQRLLMQELINGRNINSAEIASQMLMSTRTLSRHLNEEGTSLLNLIKNVRIERAEWLLLSSDLPLAKVAHQLGFSDQTTFTRAFKQATGRTPGELRKYPTQEVTE